MTSCPHTDRLAMYDGYMRSVERCTLCNEVTFAESEPCGCTSAVETDILGRYVVRIRCAHHTRPECHYCGDIIYGKTVRDTTEVAWMEPRGLPSRAWCSEDHREESAARQGERP